MVLEISAYAHSVSYLHIHNLLEELDKLTVQTNVLESNSVGKFINTFFFS